jgi:hypothetical protein
LPVAVTAAVLTYLATWALVVVGYLFGAAKGSSILPSPSSWSLRAVYVAVAILGGLLTFRACRERELSRRQAAVPAGLALAAVLVVSGSTYAVGAVHEHSYLEHLPPGVSRADGLVYGHQACDWLADQPFGRPPGPDHLPNLREAQGETLVYGWAWRARWHWANSTERLAVYYIEHLDAQDPGPLTETERRQASVIGSAWFELCPFQQWVHRPVGGSGGD